MTCSSYYWVSTSIIVPEASAIDPEAVNAISSFIRDQVYFLGQMAVLEF